MPRDKQIQFRRDTAANWTSVNPTLAAGEPGYETDTNKIKYGDGTTAWTSLSYAPATSGGLLTTASVTGASLSTSSTTPVDMDATNLVVTFNAPASGKAIVILEGFTANSANTAWFWSLRTGTTNVTGTERRIRTDFANGNRTRVSIHLSGLTAGQSYTYKWAHRTAAGTASVYTQTTSEFSGTSIYGAATMEVWAA